MNPTATLAEDAVEQWLARWGRGSGEAAERAPAMPSELPLRLRYAAELLQALGPLAPGRYLLTRNRDGAVRAHRIEGALEVGREGAGCTVNDDPELSRRHFRVRADADGARLTDLGSANGTFVNDQPSAADRELRDGDMIQAGQSIFVYVDCVEGESE